MSHARLTQARLFDWIRASIDTGKPLPTDREIMDQFDLHSIESARGLVADLSDAGKISIKGFGDDRVITLGKAAVPKLVPTRPTPSVVKRFAGGARTASVDETVAKLMAIQARPKSVTVQRSPAVAPVVAAPRAVVARVETAAIADPIKPSAAQVAVAPPPAAPPPPPPPPPPPSAPAPPPKLNMQRLATAPGRVLPPPPTSRVPITGKREDRRQLNIHLSSDTYARLDAAAEAAKRRPTEHARTIIMQALDLPFVPAASRKPGPKPAIPASIAAAAIRHGFGITDFATMCLSVGLAAFEHDALGGDE